MTDSRNKPGAGSGAKDAGALDRLRSQLALLAGNLSWTWRPESAAMFARLGPKLWERSGHNPVAALADLEEERWQELAADESFTSAVGVEAAALAEQLASTGWYGRRELAPGQEPAAWPVESRRSFQAAYFCAEFGLAESLPIYSGGLGLLAGDHLKAASGLGLPLVAVGLLYHRGYFRQRLNEDAEQEEFFVELEPGRQPLRHVTDPVTKLAKRVWVDLPGRRVQISIWRCDVGRVALYLLDTDLSENEARDREITRNLYLGDHDMRVRQEIVLGIGGVRALAAAGESPTVFHMNEGHSAFLGLERIRVARAAHPMSFDQAREAIAAGNVFTTHTPVPAGIDRFSPALVASYFPNCQEELGLDTEGLMALGRENVADRSEAFSMAVLAIRTSRFCNGVSKLHGRVSRGMWRNIWPGVPMDDVPIGHVTNGVHASGWVGSRVAALLDSAAGRSWREHADDARAWARVDEISDEELWRARQESRGALVQWVRQRLRDLAVRRGASDTAMARAASVLNPEVMTIGFARRFAQYKRGTLLLRNPERLERLLRGSRPVQVIVSGKAHPGDAGGKRLIQSLVRFAQDRGLDDRLVFLEDYDIDVARHLVQGCDVWLNTPIRGLEASGTSGMKAAMNGVIHVSTLDGWWDEGFSSEVGYHIESVGVFDHDLPNDHREDFESDALYRLLESQIVPEFYDRATDEEGRLVPRRWVARMRSCIKVLAPRFSTHRMVKEYAQQYYFPAHNAATRLEADGFAPAIALADQVARIRRHWGRVKVNSVHSEPVRGGAAMEVAAVVELGDLGPDDVCVQVSRGLLDRHGELGQAEAFTMEHEKDLHDGAHRFRVRFTPLRASREAWMVRVLPHDRSMVTPYIPGLIVSGSLNRAEAHAESHG